MFLDKVTGIDRHLLDAETIHIKVLLSGRQVRLNPPQADHGAGRNRMITTKAGLQ